MIRQVLGRVRSYRSSVRILSGKGVVVRVAIFLEVSARLLLLVNTAHLRRRGKSSVQVRIASVGVPIGAGGVVGVGEGLGRSEVFGDGEGISKSDCWIGMHVRRPLRARHEEEGEMRTQASAAGVMWPGELCVLEQVPCEGDCRG